METGNNLSQISNREDGKTKFFTILVASIAAWTLNFLFAAGYLFSETKDKGSLGDTFGIVNSLFTGLAFTGVVWSVLMQREDLRIARKETERTKAIMKLQQENIKEQAAATVKQIFETTFFQLFSRFSDISKDYSVVAPNAALKREGIGHDVPKVREYFGKEVFLGYLELLEKDYRIEEIQRDHGFSRRDPQWEDANSSVANDAIRIGFRNLFREHGHNLGQYYRSLYTLLNFINEAQFEEKEKWFYFKLVRAQLSNDEATMLALNALSKRTTLEFNSIIVKYGLLKNSNKRNHILHSLINSFNPMAFGRTWIEYSGASISGRREYLVDVLNRSGNETSRGTSDKRLKMHWTVE